MGNVSQIDSAFVFIENLDVSSVLTVTASATGTYIGGDVTCLNCRGGRFAINFTSINATCTARFAVQAKDAASGLYVTIASLSLDAQTTGNVNTLNVINIYPGIGTPGGANETNFSDQFSRVMRVIASITATASGGSPAASIKVGLNKSI